MNDDVVIRICNETDIVTARQNGRALAGSVGFSMTDQTLIATAISEVARNIVEYAGTGEIVLSRIDERGRRGILVLARDQGPGIADIDRALRDGYSTANSLGLGLPGARRLMDQLDVVSELGMGTTISMKKWAF